MKPYVLAIDQGTSATKAILVDRERNIVSHGSAPVALSAPKPGWVEQSAEEIWESCGTAVASCLEGHDPGDVAAVGLSTQRESLLLWDRATGRPMGPMLSWLDRRTAGDLRRDDRTAGDLRRDDRTAGDLGRGSRTTGEVSLDPADMVKEVSGLPLDPMFSAPKARWLLDEYDPDRSRAKAGELCLGTVDSWLLYKLGGDHLIEVGNAARTQLMDVRERTWDKRLTQLFDVPHEVLPTIVSSQGPFPGTKGLGPLPDGIPVTAVLGDSHAALFAHCGWTEGTVKATYGTGSSVMAVASPTARVPQGMCLTVAWDVGEPTWAIEGNIRSTGATLTWLAGVLGLEPDDLADQAAESSEGVVIVPAFSGLGAPWWDDAAVGLISGVTFGTRAEHLARAALESIAFQIEDVLSAVERDSAPITTLLVDGGPTSNETLMQLQADTSGRTVERSPDRDLSALGAAHLAGLTHGLWSQGDLEILRRTRETYVPQTSEAERESRLRHWHDAVDRARHQGGAPA